MGGPTISSDRFFDELKAIKIKYGGEVYDIPQVICFTEFKPNEEDMLVKLYEKNVHEVFEGKFWFIPQPTIARRGGICFFGGQLDCLAQAEHHHHRAGPDVQYRGGYA